MKTRNHTRLQQTVSSSSACWMVWTKTIPREYHNAGTVPVGNSSINLVVIPTHTQPTYLLSFIPLFIWCYHTAVNYWHGWCQMTRVVVGIQHQLLQSFHGPWMSVDDTDSEQSAHEQGNARHQHTVTCLIIAELFLSLCTKSCGRRLEVSWDIFN